MIWRSHRPTFFCEIVRFGDSLFFGRYMCEGPDAVLMRKDSLNMLRPALAALGLRSERRQARRREAWVSELATYKRADDLVVLATRRELKVDRDYGWTVHAAKLC